jgi:hypothetical protein
MSIHNTDTHANMHAPDMSRTRLEPLPQGACSQTRCSCLMPARGAKSTGTPAPGSKSAGGACLQRGAPSCYAADVGDALDGLEEALAHVHKRAAHISTAL